MNTIEQAFFLKKTSLFSDLDLDFLLTIAETTEITIYKENEIIFKNGFLGQHMFFVVSGSISIINTANEHVKDLIVADFFGDESLFNKQKRDYIAKTNKETSLLSISRTHLISIIKEFPSIALKLLELYSLNSPLRIS